MANLPSDIVANIVTINNAHYRETIISLQHEVDILKDKLHSQELKTRTFHERCKVLETDYEQLYSKFIKQKIQMLQKTFKHLK